ncbi:hypothetical protein HF086_002774 [Spodoptera exigua]|uniref:Dynein axonemal assembly factor 1 homolog n=1 Tax=Spodoptera exigua TaxID=7107 RepID=A0A922M9N5_SPOEX|nr:hypothetical protein HF086_002774 [Spodoptera exigua]
MDVPDATKDPQYIDKKREELRIFFQDVKLPKETIEKAIENELKPLKTDLNRPYIAAADQSDVKTEKEVMSGQPFTKIDDHGKPYSSEEIREMLKDNPIIAEKARQIQIMAQNENLNKQIAIPLEEINVSDYNDMRRELDDAKGDKDKIKNLNYKNMLSLMTSVSNYKAKCAIKTDKLSSERSECVESDSDEKEYEAIEKVVSQYTTKSYETRFQETKDMLGKLADRYDEGESSQISNEEITSNQILKDSSVLTIKGHKGNSVIKEVQEMFAINETMNIPLTIKPAALERNLKSDEKTEVIKPAEEEDENMEVREVFPKSFEAKLKDTEEVLRGINSVLNNAPSAAPVSNETLNEIDLNLNSHKIENENEPQKFDETMQQTLHDTLEGIFDSNNGGNSENNEMEFKEMKNLARNIVEGAENLSTLIREDITNKLNSMNELLNDVNEALDNSRKSNIAYEKIKKEGEILRGEIKPAVKEIQENDEHVTDPQMDSIHDAITKLNSELKHHEERINQSKARYEQRNDECKTFIKEVDELLLKSQTILRPMRKKIEEERKKETADDIKLTTEAHFSVEDQSTNENKADVVENVKKTRKELWDVDFSYQNEKHKKIAESQKAELERSKKLNNLLCDIKDKMKDNKEVIKLANNMLRREENKRKGLIDNSGKIRELPPEEIDTKAQGDHIEPLEVDLSNDVQFAFSEVEMDLAKDKHSEEMKKHNEAAKERIKQREFQRKVEKELEDMNKTPRMTKEFIKNHCRQHKLYCTPYLNDILYLHFKASGFYCYSGFSKIENLEEYTGLKCIFLENNGIQKIEGLDTLSELKCLYLHYNVLRKIENLDGCPKLDTLNIDHNFVSKIENLDVVPDLHTLSIAHNMLSAVDDLVHLRLCRNLSVLDLSYNRLEDPLIVDVLADMVILKVLVLTGNPVVRNIPAYRKTLTLRLKELLNLDNRPVFPRDRACAEAWQRGGVQEEIAERRRWIARDQEKVMESVRYLIRMRDEKKAIREAKEKEEREKAGLPEKEEEKPDKNEESNKDLLKIEDPSVQEDSAEVKVKEGVAVDMLSGSGEEDSTSEEKTGNIEWSQVDRSKHLVQEITNEPPPPVPDDYWYGYGNIKPKNEMPVITSEFQAINNLLFNQDPHTGRKGVTKILEVFIPDSKSRDKKRITEINPEEEQPSVSAEKKALIEIIEAADSKDTDKKQTCYLIEDVTQTNTQIIDKDQTVFKESTEGERDEINIEESKVISDSTKVEDKNNIVQDNKSALKKSKATKKIPIAEIPLESKDNSKDSSQNSEDNNVDEKQEAQSQGSENNVASTSEGVAGGNLRSQTEGDGVALINYMRRMNTVEIDESNLDLEPSAEDLEIFAELERDEAERQARIDRGEPPVDPMKLYDKKKMDAYYKEKDSVPAHLVQEKTIFTTYKHDNAFDRVALSQLTAGEKPDESKVKLTQVPGAVLFQYVDNQAPAADVNYEIGEEDVESAPSSGDTDSLNIESDTNASDEECKDKEPITKKPNNRPATAARGKQNIKTVKENTTSKDKSKSSEKYGGSSGEKKPIGKKYDSKSGGQKADRKSLGKRHDDRDNEDFIASGVTGEQDSIPSDSNYTNVATEYPSASNILPSSYDTMLNLDRTEAKRSIINTINSYEDKRFPSQGVNRADMVENDRIDQNVATEILDRTLQYEEREMYRQYDVMTSHAGNIDNKTNAIIERMSGELENEYTLPEVSHILEVHMDAAAQRWRAGDFVQFIPGSPSGSLHDVNDDPEATLIASNNDSLCLEDTLTEENVNRISAGAGDDSGIGNDITLSDTTEVHNKSVDGNEKSPNASDDLVVEDNVCRVGEWSMKNLESVNRAIASGSGDASSSGFKVEKNEPNEKDSTENDLNDSKAFESILGDENFINDESTDDIFEDCVDDVETGKDKEDGGGQFDRVAQNYSLEMKLALGIEDGKS